MPLLGVLNLNKPAGITSHDAVDALRKIAKLRQVGHTGTLDPMATGVLPLCLGKATKIAQFMIAQDKEYEVEMMLGTITDSQDTSGVILEQRDWSAITEEDIRRLPGCFSGDLKQVPPMVSAKHFEGKRLYQLAREGIEVQRDAIAIHIESLEILSIDIPKVRFRVVSSKGTYIRTLCHDMGQYLGPGGTMSALVRTRCGSFHIRDSANLSDLTCPDDVAARLHSLDDALATLPAVTIAENSRRIIMQGQGIRGSNVLSISGRFDLGDTVRIRTATGELLAIGQAELSSEHVERLGTSLNVVRPIRVLIGGR